jgi:C-terminal processing protease CtpA/Prc
MNYFYDRIWIKFPDEYSNIEKLSNGKFKSNFAGIYFRKALESSAVKSKRLQNSDMTWFMKDKKFESLLTSEKGIIVDQVMQGSIADKAGLKDGDIITEFRGEKVVMPYMFELMMLGYAPEGRINVSYLRAGQEFKTAFVYNVNNGETKSTKSPSSSGNSPKKTNKKPVVKPAVKKHQ